ncbi:PilZ domain-containing protein [Hydrogenovibrio kuenenii]|uniref:PilZ domain-containing protein n=1 Tax=Hydrogenovibrio kuenenii TaxID=63658 RepID=UPI0009FFCB93
MNTSTNDRRHFERVSTERPVTLRIQEQPIQGKMIDLSLRGAGVLIHDTCVTTNQIELSFVLPTNTNYALSLSATITHSSPVRGQCLLGLEFINTPRSQETAIKEFIRFHHRLD